MVLELHEKKNPSHFAPKLCIRRKDEWVTTDKNISLICYLEPLLLTRINFNPSMGK